VTITKNDVIIVGGLISTTFAAEYMVQVQFAILIKQLSWDGLVSFSFTAILYALTDKLLATGYLLLSTLDFSYRLDFLAAGTSPTISSICFDKCLLLPKSTELFTQTIVGTIIPILHHLVISFLTFGLARSFLSFFLPLSFFTVVLLLVPLTATIRCNKNEKRTISFSFSSVDGYRITSTTLSPFSHTNRIK